MYFIQASINLKANKHTYIHTLNLLVYLTSFLIENIIDCIYNI